MGGGAAAVLGVRGAAAVFGVGGAARRFWAIFRRRSRSARFAAVFCPGFAPCFAAIIPRAGLCTVFCGGHSACRTLRRTFMPGVRPNY